MTLKNTGFLGRIIRKLFLRAGWVIIPVSFVESMEATALSDYRTSRGTGARDWNAGYFNGLADSSSKLAHAIREKYFPKKYMNTPKFTTGPWRVFESGLGFPGIEADRLTIVVFGDKEVEDDDGGIRGRDQDEIDANARLIAAAPDLYQSLQELLSISGPSLVADRAKAAIQKATIGHQ